MYLFNIISFPKIYLSRDTIPLNKYSRHCKLKLMTNAVMIIYLSTSQINLECGKWPSHRCKICKSHFFWMTRTSPTYKVHLLNVKTVMEQFLNRTVHFRKQKILRNYGEEKIQMYNVFYIVLSRTKDKSKKLILFKRSEI
jgi:hypothetical protein